MNLHRRGLGPLIATVALVAGLLGYTLAAGNVPFLGLDLQGGVAVILSPTGPADDEQLEDAVSIIRSRVDAIGVAEPEITRQGQNISVEIPGVSDRQQAIDLVGQTGELAFRPVQEEFSTGFPVDADGEPVFGEAELEGLTIDGLDDIDGVGDDPVEGDGDANGSTDEGSWPGVWRGADGEVAAGSQNPDVELPPGDPTGDPTGDADLPLTPDGQIDLDQLPDDLRQQLVDAQQGLDVDATDSPASSLGVPELTADPELSDVVVEAQYRVVDGQRFEVARYRLGPASLTGAGLEGASASLDERGQWVVRPVFRSGPDGIDAFNVTASACFAQDLTCPSGLFAITLDNEVISALGVQAPTFGRDAIVISGGFTEQSARELATVLRYGALPVELEIQSVQEVSATLGRDALRAGVVAGLIGIGLVSLFMLLSYRLLGLTAVAKLLIEVGLLWSIISWLGSTQGLALTLAGVTGIVVSIGLSVDSNVVFFETVKEDIRNGRSLRSAADRSFAAAWRTIVKADLASLIAAVLLYALAVGPVRGFAFYLGLATLLDLFVAWFFMRPSATLSLRSGLAARRPGLFGLPSGAVAGSVKPAGLKRPHDPSGVHAAAGSDDPGVEPGGSGEVR